MFFFYAKVTLIFEYKEGTRFFYNTLKKFFVMDDNVLKKPLMYGWSGPVNITCDVCIPINTSQRNLTCPSCVWYLIIEV